MEETKLGKSIHKKTDGSVESTNNVLCFLILTAFATLNINPGFGSFEYFPLIALFLVIASGRTTNYHTSIALLLISISFFTSLNPGNTEHTDLTNNIKIVIALVFFIFGGLAFENYKFTVNRACDYILIAHAIYLLLYILNPEIIFLLQKLLGLRGIIYEGKISFFSSEPSYAAINLMGIYILSLRSDKSKRNKIINAAIATICLLSTKSITATIFVIAIIIFNVNLKKLTILGSLISIFILGNLSTIDNNDVDSPITRIKGVLAFASDKIDGQSIKEILNVIEPSGMWRYLVNTANLDIGLGRILGTGSLNLTHQLSSLDPELHQLIIQNPTYETMPAISTQAILPAFTMFLGLIGFIALSVVVILSISGHLMCASGRNLDGKLISIYLIIGALWQSALTAPLWWILLSLGICKIIGKITTNSGINPTIEISIKPKEIINVKY